MLAEARAYGDRVSTKDKRDREDLRGLDLVTIDPLTARDHDDAIFIERGEQGGYRVVVAIADVSHYVQEGSALDAEALARSTRIYLPDRAIPMLPPELSGNLASLVAGKDRLTLAVDIDLGRRVARCAAFRYVEGLMRCKAGLTYEGVAHALGLTQQGRVERAAQRYSPMLEVLHECAMLLRNRRMKRGSLDFDLPEPYVDIDPQSGEPQNGRALAERPGRAPRLSARRRDDAARQRNGRRGSGAAQDAGHLPRARLARREPPRTVRRPGAGAWAIVSIPRTQPAPGS